MQINYNNNGNIIKHKTAAVAAAVALAVEASQ